MLGRVCVRTSLPNPHPPRLDPVKRLHRIQIAMLLLPILGGGLAGLRWMHETLAHGLGGSCEVAAACGDHVHSHHDHSHHDHGHHRHDDHHGETRDACRGHAPASGTSSDGEGERGSEPAHSNCLSCELLAVMVTGGLDLADLPMPARVSEEVPGVACTTRPLAAPAAARARPPPHC